jgi:hypothetical protein
MQLSLALVFLLVAAAPASATALRWDTDRPERSFLFNGKPVDPRCVTRLVEETSHKRVDLRGCEAEQDHSKITRRKSWIEVDGSSDGGMSIPYDSYEVVARNGSRFVIATDWSGGGTGKFTDLIVVSKSDAAFSVEKSLLHQTDRCNGGLDNPRVEGDKLLWSEDITPSDVVRFGDEGLSNVYSQLDGSAINCVATRNMDYDLDTGKVRFISIRLTGQFYLPHSKFLKDEFGGAAAYQHCFNEYYNGFVERGQTVLDPAAIKEFARGFTRACVSKP